jgi:hypothetical protein
VSDFLGFCAKSEGIVRPLMLSEKIVKKWFLELGEIDGKTSNFESVQVTSLGVFPAIFRANSSIFRFLENSN